MVDFFEVVEEVLARLIRPSLGSVSRLVRLNANAVRACKLRRTTEEIRINRSYPVRTADREKRVWKECASRVHKLKECE